MCGIAGMLNLSGRPPSADDVRDMCAAMIHRGPDDEGVHVTPEVGLGMRWLSIIDLATGSQPVRNEDGSVWVVFNGEIYNFAELRRRLEACGHVFYTATDTEAIVHLYEEYGERCVEHLRGMFAFAVWDARRRRLLLARDRIGIKPLYYGVVAGRLVFASELKAILRLPDVDRRIDWRSASHLFSFLATSPSDSIIEGIRKLEPGHTLVASPDQAPRTERYWDLRFAPDHRRSEADTVEELRHVLRECVRLHLVADVPVGAFLSGGIDSSSVVAMMAGLVDGPVRTFSIGFPEADYSELGHARRVAERFGTEHHERIVEPDALGLIEELAWHLDEPFGDPSALPTYIVSKLAAQHVKVVLSGDGGDEVFGGYEKYVVEGRERSYRLPWPARRLLRLARHVMPDGMRGRNFAHHFSLQGAARYVDACTLFREDAKARLFRPEIFAQMAEYAPARGAIACLDGMKGDWLSALQYLDVNAYLPLDILTKVDRMSMAHSLEARVPLLDHTLVEFAATIPATLKLRAGTTKHVFKHAMRGLLPDEIIDRPKQGFAVPLARWFRRGLIPVVRELLLSDTSRRRGIFEAAYIERLLVQHANGRPLDWQLWMLIVFEMWCRTVLDRPTTRRERGRDLGAVASGCPVAPSAHTGALLAGGRP